VGKKHQVELRRREVGVDRKRRKVGATRARRFDRESERPNEKGKSSRKGSGLRNIYTLRQQDMSGKNP